METESVIVDFVAKFNGTSKNMEKLAKEFAADKKKEGKYDTKLFKTESGFTVKCHCEYNDIDLIDDEIEVDE